jgi:predicted ATPase/DNA-binding SARP family transcriptional activator
MANLMLGLLGSLQVLVANEPITNFESNKARALLAYLAVEAGSAHRRESLIGLLWPDSPEEAARHNLRQTLLALRQAIGDRTAKPPYLLITRDEIQFNTAADYSLDVAAFDAQLATCGRHPHRQLETCSTCAAHLQQAAELYRGKFLQEFFLQDSAPFEEWALVQRERLHQRALEALTHLTAYYEQRADYEAARRYASRQLELDPWREQAHRQLMRALALVGLRSEALIQYETCRRVLGDELGVEPSAETQSLYAQISRGELTAKPEEAPHAPPVTLHPLPPQLTPFIGRERELADLHRLLSDPQCRLLTLVGPGGIGKTRLALQAAANQRQAFIHGAAFVSLASVASPALIVHVIAEALGLAFHSASDPKAQLLSYLTEKQVLLVLDNLEHLMAGAGLCVEILEHALEVKVLVTSREQLNLSGEWVFEVEGLAFPRSEIGEGFEGYSAVSLFRQRAQRARVGFELKGEDRAAVARICRLVEGMPLGIELAAAWVRTLSCREIAQQIERNLDFLAVSMRDLPERHRSLRAVFNQSWSMLTAEERLVMSKLSVFRGGFQREAAERVAGASLSVLASLVAKSLVRRTEGDRPTGTASGRYDLHEIVRQYARERLIESGEFEAACGEHMRFFLELAEAAEPELRRVDQIAWLDRLERDHDNLRAALGWSLDCAETDDDRSLETRERAGRESLRLAGALYMFWKRRAHWSEGRDWLKRALALTSDLPVVEERAKALDAAVLLAAEQADTKPASQLAEQNLALARESGDSYSIARALDALGFLLWKKKDFAAARASCEKALGIFRRLGDRSGAADALHDLSHVAINQGDYQAAQSFCGEAAAIYRELGDNLGLTDALGDLGLLAYLLNDFAAARAYLDESLARFQEAASVPGTVSALNRLGDLARCRGDYDEAGKLYTESVALYRDMGDKDELPSLLHNQGYVALHCGDHSQALALFEEGLAMQVETGNQAGIAECLAGIAGVVTARGEGERGARLFGAAEALHERNAAAIWPANRIEYDRSLALLRASLDEATLAAAWAEGRAMSMERAIAEARDKTASDLRKVERSTATNS